MTPPELQDLFIATLVREAGGNRRRWRIAVGPVKLYSRTTHPHCNWSVAPTGTAHEIDCIERMVDMLRERHPVLISG